MDDDVQLRSLQARVARLEATNAWLVGLAREYVPRVEANEALLADIDRAGAILRLAGEGGGDGGPRHARQRPRRRGSWLTVVPAGTVAAAALRWLCRPRVSPVPVALTAALLGGGAAAVPALRYQPAPGVVRIHAKPAQQPAAFITITPQPPHHARRRDPEPAPSPSATPTPSPDPPPPSPSPVATLPPSLPPVQPSPVVSTPAVPSGVSRLACDGMGAFGLSCTKSGSNPGPLRPDGSTATWKQADTSALRVASGS